MGSASCHVPRGEGRSFLLVHLLVPLARMWRESPVYNAFGPHFRSSSGHQRPFRGLSKRHPQPASSPCKSETIRSLGVLAALRYRRAVQNVFRMRGLERENRRILDRPSVKLTKSGSSPKAGRIRRAVTETETPHTKSVSSRTPVREVIPMTWP